MPSLRQIRRKIRSAQKIEQITKTMQMVAASRFRRCDEQLGRVRPYMRRLEEVSRRVTHGLAPAAHPLLRPASGGREPHRAALVLVTSDRGLCGAYNTTLLDRAARFVQEMAPAKVAFVFVGRRGHDAYKRHRVEQLLPATGFGSRPDRAGATALAGRLIAAFLAGEISAVYLLYTAYLRAFTFRPVLVKLLELSWDSAPSPPASPVDYLFEPTRQQLLDALLPHYVEMRVYAVLTEAMTAENSARMISMKNATENAGEMIDQFTLLRNKARQAAITKEIAEIVTAAEALT